MGDFNEVLKIGERARQTRIIGSMEFKARIDQMGLMDVNLSQGKFTWRIDSSRTRIDRTLIDQEWSIKFPDLKLVRGKHQFSDHNPLILQATKSNDWGPKPFKVYSMWFNNPEFKTMLKEEWKALCRILVHRKLKALILLVKSQSKERYGNLDLRISKLTEEQERLNKINEERDLSLEQLKKNRAVFVILNKLMIKYDIWF